MQQTVCPCPCILPTLFLQTWRRVREAFQPMGSTWIDFGKGLDALMERTVVCPQQPFRQA